MIRLIMLTLLTGISLSSVALATPNYTQAAQQIANAVNHSQQEQAAYLAGTAPNSPFSALNQVASDGLPLKPFVLPSNPAPQNTPSTTRTTVPERSSPPAHTAVPVRSPPPARTATPEQSKDTTSPQESAGISGVSRGTNTNENNSSSPLNF